MRVGFRKNSGGWMGAYHPVGHGVRDERWTGPTVEFIKEVAKLSGCYLNITEPPEEIKSNSVVHTASSSSFTQCVFATALGYVDFCVALFTVTSQRNSMTPFFVLESQPVYAFSKEVDRNFDLTSGFMIISRPFKPAVWNLFLLTIMILSALFAVQEFGLSGSMFAHEYQTNASNDSKADPRISRSLTRMRTFGAIEDVIDRLDRDGDGKVSTKECKHYLRALLESFYYAFLSITSGGVAHTAVSPGGRVTLVGFGVFILLALTQYTSTLTSQMVVASQTSVINSVEQAVARGLNFCGERMDSEQLMRLYPRANFLADPSDGVAGFSKRSDVFPAVDSGECDVAICVLEDLQKYRGDGLHCDKAMIGKTPVYSVDWGMPLTDSRARALAYHMNEAKTKGLWDSLKLQNEPTSQCVEKSRNDQVAVGQFFAVFSISAGISLLGFIITCIARGRGSRLRKTHPEAGQSETRSRVGVPPQEFVQDFVD